MRRGTLVLGLLLALTACPVTVTVSLPDQTLDLPGLADTGGKVVYPKDGLSFSPPPVDVVRGIRVEGVLETSEPLNITLEFYARTQDPSQDPTCTAPTFPQGIGVEPVIYLMLHESRRSKGGPSYLPKQPAGFLHAPGDQAHQGHQGRQTLARHQGQRPAFRPSQAHLPQHEGLRDRGPLSGSPIYWGPRLALATAGYLTPLCPRVPSPRGFPVSWG
jgi:hypothetical protein